MTRPTKAEVSIAALRRNLELISRSTSGEGAEPPAIIGVVKANAYGHGAVEVSLRLIGWGIKWLAVACVEEAVELADAGVLRDNDTRVIILGPVLPGDMEEIAGHGFVPVISDPDDLAMMEEACRKPSMAGSRLEAVLYLDTGMGRTGILAEQVNEVCERARQASCLEVIGLFSHFPSADGKDEADLEYTRGQIRDFQLLSQAVLRSFPGCRLVSIANSSGIFYHPSSIMNAVRPGIALYGVRPDSNLFEPAGLQPVMRLVTKIAQVRDLPAGAPVSYGRKTVLQRPSRLALLPVGYADGLNRRLPPGFKFSVKGMPAPLAGVVTMDLTVVDVTDIPGARPGDRVLLMGRESERFMEGSVGHEDAVLEVPAEVHAREAGTIPYEILTSVGERVKRVYVKEE